MRSEPSFEYLGNNRIRLYGWPKTILEFELACEHDENGESIPESCYDSFMELATLDTENFLYQTLKYYDEIPTAWGTIKLNIQSYESAADRRKTLLDDWRDKFHVDDDSAIKFM